MALHVSGFTGASDVPETLVTVSPLCLAWALFLLFAVAALLCAKDDGIVYHDVSSAAVIFLLAFCQTFLSSSCIFHPTYELLTRQGLSRHVCEPVRACDCTRGYCRQGRSNGAVAVAGRNAGFQSHLY